VVGDGEAVWARVPGGLSRAVALGVALLPAAVLAVVLVNVDSSWGRDDFYRSRSEH
jgi:hypothetical protein